MHHVIVLLHGTGGLGTSLREFSFEPQKCLNVGPRVEPVQQEESLPSFTFWQHGAVASVPTLLASGGIEMLSKNKSPAGTMLAAVPFTASAIPGETSQATPQILTSPWHSVNPGLSAVSAPVADAVQHCLKIAWQTAAAAADLSALQHLPDQDTVFLTAGIIASWWCELFVLGSKLVSPAQGPGAPLHHPWGLSDTLALLHHTPATRAQQPKLFKQVIIASSLLHSALTKAAAALVGAAGGAKWRRCLHKWRGGGSATHCPGWPRLHGVAAAQGLSTDAPAVQQDMVPCEDSLQHLLCLVHANAHPLSRWGGGNGSSGLAMAPGAALFNHSSHPNAVAVVLGEEARVEVRASRDIAPGEPIRVTYVDGYRPPSARRSALLDTFFFEEHGDDCFKDLIAAYTQRPFGREMLVSLHAGAAVLPEQPRHTDGQLWAAADPCVLSDALACSKCLVGAVVPCCPLLRDAPVTQLRSSVAGKLCSLLTLSSSSGSIKPRSGPNVTQTPPPTEATATEPVQVAAPEFLPVLPIAAGAAEGSATRTSPGKSVQEGRCVFCGVVQDVAASPALHRTAEGVLKGAAVKLQGGDAAACLALLQSAQGQRAFTPLHFYNRSHFDRLLLANSACTAARDWGGGVHLASRALHILQAMTPAPSVQSAVLLGSQASSLLMLWRTSQKAGRTSPPDVAKGEVCAALRLAVQEMDRSTGPHYPLYARLRRALDSLG